MGADLEASPWRIVLDRAERALRAFEVAPGALRRLMAGENQARRDRGDAGWRWTGDFPLSMVAQTALGVALSLAFIERHGPPRLVAGESMGELAAMCVAGALSLEETAALTYRWARDLAVASDRLGLRMAVVEDLDEEAWRGFASSCEANVVVSESAHLYVAALPSNRLDDLDSEVVRRGGRTLVSSNHCAAHEPRLAADSGTWDAHARYLEKLDFRAASISIPSTLDPGSFLNDADGLRRNRVETTFRRVRWGETLAVLPALGIRNLVQFGPLSSGYALKKLRSENARLAHARIRIVPGLSAIPQR
jgi:malonyl CoA-acyl carrier protein transacylase